MSLKNRVNAGGNRGRVRLLGCCLLANCQIVHSNASIRMGQFILCCELPPRKVYCEDRSFAILAIQEGDMRNQ